MNLNRERRLELKNYTAKVGISRDIAKQNRQIKLTYDTVHNSRKKKDTTVDDLKNDAKMNMMKNKKEAKTISAMLRRVVNSGDSSHFNLEEKAT